MLDTKRRDQRHSDPVTKTRDKVAFSPELGKTKTACLQAVSVKRMKGLEPSTFCMASRRSSQLSYIRGTVEYRSRRLDLEGLHDALRRRA